jgi:hypothetical protein
LTFHGRVRVGPKANPQLEKGRMLLASFANFRRTSSESAANSHSSTPSARFRGPFWILDQSGCNMVGGNHRQTTFPISVVVLLLLLVALLNIIIKEVQKDGCRRGIVHVHHNG